jgi:hypothetical protein
MSDTSVEQRTTNPKANEWAERIAAQQRSGISVKQFCKERGLTEYSFYAWRKRLQESGPLRFRRNFWKDTKAICKPTPTPSTMHFSSRNAA